MAGNIFNTIEIKDPQSSWFDLTHDHKTTLNMGDLIPVLCQETLPGDSFEISMQALFRMAPMIAPVMHKVAIYAHAFFVPNRIVWKNWEKFISPGNISTEEVIPPLFAGDILEESITKYSLAHRLGLPVCDFMEVPVSAIPMAAYQRIYWDYYRAQDLQLTEYNTFEEFAGLQDAGQNAETLVQLRKLRKRAWEHDYFTSALPFAQKGDPVSIPIEVTVGVNVPVNFIPNGNPWLVKNTDGSEWDHFQDVMVQPGLPGETILSDDSPGDHPPMNLDPNGTLRAIGDADEISSTTTINDLRSAYALQRFLEKNARAGTRYTESLLAHWGVRSSDARLQRAEYLGGTRSLMAISEVLSTQSNALIDTAPLGTMGGHGISTMDGEIIRYRCEEHGHIMLLISILPITSYYQGINRSWTRYTRLDYAWPDFAFLGEQAIKNHEIYYTQGDPGLNQNTWGYIPRYSEYRYNQSRISGDFQDLLNFWGLQREFNSLPALNGDFVECDASGRIFALDPYSLGNPQSIIAHVVFQMGARRKLPKYGTPGII